MGRPVAFWITFNLKSLDELPTLEEIKNFDDIHPELALNEDDSVPANTASEEEAEDRAEKKADEKEAILTAPSLQKRVANYP